MIITETSADMSRFLTPGHLPSWAGAAPLTQTSPTRCLLAHWRPRRHGHGCQPHHRHDLPRRTYLARHIGRLKALVAIEHSILTAVWHVLPGNTGCQSLAGDYHAQRNAQRALMHHSHANRFGYPSASTQSTPHH